MSDDEYALKRRASRRLRDKEESHERGLFSRVKRLRTAASKIHKTNMLKGARKVPRKSKPVRKKTLPRVSTSPTEVARVRNTNTAISSQPRALAKVDSVLSLLKECKNPMQQQIYRNASSICNQSSR